MFGLDASELTLLAILLAIPTVAIYDAFARSRRGADEAACEIDVARESFSRDAWRDGDLLVMTPDSVLPDRCVRTGLPACGQRLQQTVRWHHPALYLVLLANILIYVVVALMIRRSATVRVGVSSRFLHGRRIATVAGWSLGLCGFGLVVLGSIIGSSALPEATGAVMIVVGLIWGMLGTRVVWPSRIDGEYVWLRGVDASVLELLPAWDHRERGRSAS